VGTCDGSSSLIVVGTVYEKSCTLTQVTNRIENMCNRHAQRCQLHPLSLNSDGMRLKLASFQGHVCTVLHVKNQVNFRHIDVQTVCIELVPPPCKESSAKAGCVKNRPVNRLST